MAEKKAKRVLGSPADKMSVIGKPANATETAGNRPLETRLREGWLDFARGEQAIANFLLANMHDAAFETGAVIAAGAGVSEASVARFARKLGYNDLKDMKRGLRQKSNAKGLDNAASRFRIGAGFPSLMNRTIWKMIISNRSGLPSFIGYPRAW